jgi:hypothetical protein
MCHNSSNFKNKTYVKLCHTIEYINLLWILRWWHFTFACIFFGSGSFPFLETIKPNIILQNTMNAHLFKFRLMSYYLHFWKHNLSFCKWLSMSLYTIKSSRNIFIKLSKYLKNVLVTSLWYVGGSFLTPNDIAFHIKSSLVCNKCNIVFILWNYRNLMISLIPI